MSDIIDTLNNMIFDLKKHNRSKQELIEDYINSRLDKSLKSYYEDLMQTYNSITKRDAARVLKKAMQSKGEKWYKIHW